MSKTPEEMANKYCNTKNLTHSERLLIVDGYLAAHNDITLIIHNTMTLAKATELPTLLPVAETLKGLLQKFGGL